MMRTPSRELPLGSATEAPCIRSGQILRIYDAPCLPRKDNRSDQELPSTRGSKVWRKGSRPVDLAFHPANDRRATGTSSSRVVGELQDPLHSHPFSTLPCCPKPGSRPDHQAMPLEPLLARVHSQGGNWGRSQGSFVENA